MTHVPSRNGRVRLACQRFNRRIFAEFPGPAALRGAHRRSPPLRRLRAHRPGPCRRRRRPCCPSESPPSSLAAISASAEGIDTIGATMLVAPWLAGASRSPRADRQAATPVTRHWPRSANGRPAALIARAARAARRLARLVAHRFTGFTVERRNDGLFRTAAQGIDRLGRRCLDGNRKPWSPPFSSFAAAEVAAKPAAATAAARTTVLVLAAVF